MNEIKFSVLMSVYYKEKANNLKLALDSVINQTLKPNEIVLVEDGQLTDELENLIKEYENKYDFIKIVRLEKNVGLGKALNEGLKYCNYYYVARMDSDDESLQNRFEKQIRYMEQHPNVDIVGTNVIEYDEHLKEQISERKVPESNFEIRQFIKHRNPMNHPSVIYKKKCVQEAGNYEEYPYFEDYQLWAKMIANGCEFYNIQESLYKFRAGKDMYCRRGGIGYCKCIHKFENSLKRLKLIDKRTYYKNIFKRDIGAVIPNWVRRYLYRKILRK